MPVKTQILPGRYVDSVRLMQVGRDLAGMPGVSDAAVVMATEANKAILRQAGLLTVESEAATANDLVIAVSASQEAADLALAEAGKLLAQPAVQGQAEAGSGYRPRTLRAAARSHPEANLAVISVAGRYAAAEAWQALRAGLHVLLFSDNVSIQDEIALKQYARQAGLLLMGPGAGTALVNGTGLGFANQVPMGPVGIVSAAGTGLQEVSSLLARYGSGVSQGLGTGGRDLSEAAGGLMMLACLEALQQDDSTRVIILISKPPAAPVARKILDQAACSAKPTVICFLGADPASLALPPAAGEATGGIESQIFFARSLQEAAYLGARAAGAGLPDLEHKLAEEARQHAALLESLAARPAAGQRYLRGLYSGGTLCYEAQVILRERLPERVFSNAPLSPQDRLADSNTSLEHTLLDLGEEEFTLGRPHPMIDNDLRVRRLLQEAQDPEVAAILLDVVLGYGAHPDPAAELGPAVLRARQLARDAGRELIVVASVTGTVQDPQGLAHQVQALEQAGVVICDSNAAAARLVVAILGSNWRDLVGEAHQRVRLDLAGHVLPDPAAVLDEIREERDGKYDIMPDRTIKDLFSQPIRVINIGLESMAQSIRDQGLPVVDIDWKPPQNDLPRLEVTRAGVEIDTANQEACRRIKSGRPVLVGMGIARETIPGMHDRKILHAGPPVAWERMCGPQRGAVMGALIYEGLAEDEAQAARLAASGKIEFSPCHHHHAVGPMAGVISARMPVFIVENKAFGNTAYCTLNEGLGKVLRYGGMGAEVYARLRWMETSLYPALDRALASLSSGIDLLSLMAQALHMGDECHNRNRAATSLFLRAIGPALARTSRDNETLARVIEFIDRNDHFFLNLSMPAGKALLEPAEGIQGSTIVTTMARNGTDFGIRIAGLPGRWFTAPAGMVQGLYFPGFSENDANPDIGDSAITETAGYGGFAMAAAPAITQFVGGSPQLALNTTQEMYEITYDEHEALTIPILNFRGAPLGIDVRKVMETGILPQINTGIAHKETGVGMVGAGILRAPEACFREAFEALRE